VCAHLKNASYTSPCPNGDLAFRTGSWFWKKHFNGCVRAHWQHFLEHVKEELEIRVEKQQTIEEALFSICVESQDGQQYVSIESYHHLLLWFGDLQIQTPPITSIFYRLALILKEPWYFGSISYADAATYLDPKVNENGTFLVRLNMGKLVSVDCSPFTIEYVCSNEVMHTRVMFANDRKEYQFQDTNGQTVSCPNTGLINLIQFIQHRYPHIARKPYLKRLSIDYGSEYFKKLNEKSKDKT